jgi:hypothetical protein
VAFKASTQKFYVRCQNTSSTDAKLTPNAPASKTSGIPETVFPANNDVSIEQDNNRAYLDPTFYTVCSRSVPQAMMGYGVSLSDIVAVCPVSDGLNSVYQCNDSVFPVASQVQYLYNQIDIRIYLEDTSEELPDAVFAIELELR